MLLDKKKKASGISLPSTLSLPEWIISTKTQPAPYVVEFKELFALRKDILSMTLLWTFNSYHVDVRRRQFLINGGRRISISMQPDTELLYAKRNRKTVLLNEIKKNGAGVHEITYLLGLQDVIDGRQREIMIHVSSDGANWYWRNRR